VPLGLGRRTGSIATSTVVAAILVMALPVRAHAFGTIRGIGQDAEHEKITRGAVACAPGQRMADLPGRCFERLTVDELAGTSRPDLPSLDPGHVRPALDRWLAELPHHLGSFGAVGAPDLESFFGDVPHCLAGDWLPIPDYPQTQSSARYMLLRCRFYLQKRFRLGLALSNHLVDLTGRIIPSAVEADRCSFVDVTVARSGIATFANEIKKYRHEAWLPSPRLKFVEGALRQFEEVLRLAQLNDVFTVPDAESAKCQVLGQIGHVFHGIQDFYAHGNWSDHSDATRPISILNPDRR
jgi:hypothetical protein